MKYNRNELLIVMMAFMFNLIGRGNENLLKK